MRSSLTKNGNGSIFMSHCVSLADPNLHASIYLWFSCCDFDKKYETSICSHGRKEVKLKSSIVFFFKNQNQFLKSGKKNKELNNVYFSGKKERNNDDPQGRMKVC